MSNLNWYQPLEQAASLDTIRAQWHQLLEQHQMGPANPPPGYQDAMLAFLGSCRLPPALKLAAVLALGSAFDFDFRLALGALADQVMEDEVPWPESVQSSVSDNGPSLHVATSDPWLAAFVAGRLAGLRETLVHDGARLDGWHAAFWNAFLEMACRHAAPEAVQLALEHGADPRANDYSAVKAAARGMCHDNFTFRDHGLPDASDRDYSDTLQQLAAAGLPAAEMLAVALPAAAAADNTGMLDLLLPLGADLGADGGAALAGAARQLASSAFTCLLEHGADIKANSAAVLAAAVATLTDYMVEDALVAGAEPGTCAGQLFAAALAASPYDLYPSMDDLQERRAAMVALLLRRGVLPDGPDAVDALRDARDGREVIEAVLQDDSLDADLLGAVRMLAEQAFGPAEGEAPPAGQAARRAPA